MKPYLLVLHNKIKFAIKKAHTKNFSTEGLQLLDRNSKLHFAKSSTVRFGDRMISDGRFVIITDNNAELSIGKNVYFNEDAMISCKGKITIGNGCKFGPNVKVFDNNHKFDAVNGVSNQHSIGEITIGENSWIGANAVILKGSQIGKNCVIGAGCIISKTIPDASVVTQGRELTITPMRK